jgi:hypothetical protein
MSIVVSPHPCEVYEKPTEDIQNLTEDISVIFLSSKTTLRPQYKSGNGG